MKHLLIFALALAGFNASATITVLGVSGATDSKHSMPGSVLTIFGGIAGPDCSANSKTLDTTCNSCGFGTGACPVNQVLPDQTNAQWPFCACNENRIYDKLKLVVRFMSHTSAGTPAIASNASSVPSLSGVEVQPTGPSPAGTLMTVSLPWETICQQLFDMQGFDCEVLAIMSRNLQAAVRIGVTTDGLTLADSVTVQVNLRTQTVNQVFDGSEAAGLLTNWRMVPGDKKATLANLELDAGFTPANVSAIRVFASDADFDHASPLSTIPYQDMFLNPDGSFANLDFIGLNNNPAIPYHFRTASVDPAGNVYGFTSRSNVVANYYGNCRYPVDSDPKDPCQYHASPTKSVLTR